MTNDGNLDLFLANGNPDDMIESLHPGVPIENRRFSCNKHGRGFQNVQPAKRPHFFIPVSAAGMAIGDFDNDGSVDVLDRYQ